MPQVWLSYDEIGHWLRYDTQQTAEHIVKTRWRRRRCSDGLTRVKLPPNLIVPYLHHHLKLEAIDRQADAQVQDLRSVLPHADPLHRGAVG